MDPSDLVSSRVEAMDPLSSTVSSAVSSTVSSRVEAPERDLAREPWLPASEPRSDRDGLAHRLPCEPGDLDLDLDC